MGLDNVIQARVYLRGFEQTPLVFDICYWRKCWNFRQGVVNEFHLPFDNTNFTLDYKYFLSSADRFIKVMKSQIKNKIGESIWEPKTVKKIHKGNIRKLRDVCLLANYSGAAAVVKYLASTCEGDTESIDGYEIKTLAEKSLEAISEDIVKIEFEFVDSY